MYLIINKLVTFDCMKRVDVETDLTMFIYTSQPSIQIKLIKRNMAAHKEKKLRSQKRVVAKFSLKKGNELETFVLKKPPK